MNAEKYVRRVASELRDLPWKQRRDLVAELRGHLGELPEGTDLPAAAQYAAEMRAAAGLARRRGPKAFLRARRPRTLALIAVCVTLLGVSIGAVVWIYSYQPLAFDSGFSRLPLGYHSLFGVKGDAVTFRKGKPFDLALQFANTRRFTVRILGTGFSPDMPWTAHLLAAPPSYTGNVDWEHLEPFHPFDLRPGQYAYLELKGVWACRAAHEAGTGLTVHDFLVRYGFLWRTGTAAIPLVDGDLEIRFPQGCSSR